MEVAMTNIKIAIDFSVLAHDRRAFAEYCRDLHDSDVKRDRISSTDLEFVYQSESLVIKNWLDDFFKLYAKDMIQVVPGARECVARLKSEYSDDIIIITDYSDAYVDTIREFIQKNFSGWKPVIFCSQQPLSNLTRDKKLANLLIEDFLDMNPGIAREIQHQGWVSKSQLCACLGIDEVIDTNPISAQDMALMGMDVCMMLRSWNEFHEPRSVYKAENWQDLLVQIKILVRDRVKNTPK